MNKHQIVEIEDLEIEALTDEELNGVAGGYLDTSTAESCQCCTEGATNVIDPTIDI